MLNLVGLALQAISTLALVALVVIVCRRAQGKALLPFLDAEPPAEPEAEGLRSKRYTIFKGPEDDAG